MIHITEIKVKFNSIVKLNIQSTSSCEYNYSRLSKLIKNKIITSVCFLYLDILIDTSNYFNGIQK